MTSTLPPDPWKALGVERDADKSEIRAAYKKLVLKCHPDKVQDPTLKAKKADEFQKVQEAWELLNNDAEKAKYEQKLRLAELQRAAKVQQDVKNSPNTSVPRAKYAAFDIRTAEPPSRYRSSPSGGKVYSHPHYTTRSHEEMPTSRVYPLYDDTDKYARRATSYEKPKKRDEERRERDERRRRKEDEEYRTREKERDRERDRDREREKEKSDKDREARKAEKKRLEREREKERHREADEKARRRVPYVEPYATAYVNEPYEDDVKFVTSSRSEKKRSSSRKHDETREREREREREKSSSRRAKSPHLTLEEKHMALFGAAASYQASAGGSLPSENPVFWQSAQQSPAPHAPTPPPVDFVDESLLHASARAAGRRASNDAARSREKLRHDTVDAIPKSRPVPTLTKSYSTPPPAPESPPRVSRSQTTPVEPHRQMPSLPRTQTWAPSTKSTAEYYDIIESDEDRDRRHRRSRRTRSPSGQPTRYKVEGIKATKLESAYAYGESPTSTRRYTTEELDGHLSNSPSSARRYVMDEFDGPVAHSPSGTYAGVPFGRVKESRSYSERDVKYAKYEDPYYLPHGGDGHIAV